MKISFKIGLQIVGLAVLFVAIVVGIWVVRVRQRGEPQARYSERKLVIANVRDRALSVWWSTQKPETGCVVVANSTDDQERRFCSNFKTTTHLVEANNLQPETRYALRVETDTQKMSLDPYFGKGVSTRASLWGFPPQTIRGQIVDAQQTPIGGATVFIAPNLSDRMYFPLSTTTDSAGYYQVDVSVLDFQYPPAFGDYFVEVVDQGGKKLIETVVQKPATETFPVISITSE